MLICSMGFAACTQPADRAVIAVLIASGDQISADPATDPVRVLRERIELRCPECVVVVREDTTPASLRAVVDDGADVVVAQPASAEQGVELAAAAGDVPVVAFDTNFSGAEFYVGYDRAATVELLAKEVSRQVGGPGAALVVPGAVTGGGGETETAGADPAADADAKTLRQALGKRDIRIAAQQQATADAQETQAWVTDRLQGPGGGRIAAIVAGSDAASVAVEQALSRRPISGRPILAGVGGELSAVRRVIQGDQTLAVHTPQTRTARAVADVAVSLASATQGDDLEAESQVDEVPATVFDPVIVSRDNVTEAVVRDGTYTTEQLCKGDVKAACLRLGII